MQKSLFLCTLLIMLSFTVAACGPAAPSDTINVTMTDFQFTPPQFTIPAGQQITINTTNNGAVEHEFVIFKLGTSAGDTFGPEDEANVFWRIKVQPGESASAAFTAPSEPGDYTVVCATPGHLQAGMSATLTVK